MDFLAFELMVVVTCMILQPNKKLEIGKYHKAANNKGNDNYNKKSYLINNFRDQ
jgi:hypothetical protein